MRGSFLIFSLIVPLTSVYSKDFKSCRTTGIQIKRVLESIIISLSVLPLSASSDMLTFPLPAPLKNNIVLMRSGECFADKRNEIQTNPVKKLRQDNALTMLGREQAIAAAKQLSEIGFSPTFIWTSNTERAYETAAVVAKEVQLGQNRIVPEYSFLDARAAGTYEGSNVGSWDEIHKMDIEQGINYRPPPNTDGTPSDSVSDVLVRANQLVSSIESFYSGENVLIISPDSEVLSILSAALASEDPDKELPLHAKYAFKNGEIKPLQTYVKVSNLLATGQTQKEADDSTRKVRYLRALSGRTYSNIVPSSWTDIWHASIDNIM